MRNASRRWMHHDGFPTPFATPLTSVSRLSLSLACMGTVHPSGKGDGRHRLSHCACATKNRKRECVGPAVGLMGCGIPSPACQTCIAPGTELWRPPRERLQAVSSYRDARWMTNPSPCSAHHKKNHGSWPWFKCLLLSAVSEAGSRAAAARLPAIPPISGTGLPRWSRRGPSRWKNHPG